MNILLVLALFCSFALFGKESEVPRKVEWVSRPLPEASIAGQLVHPRGCGLAAILNACRAESADSSILAQVKGESDDVKMQTLAEMFGAKPSRIFEGEKRVHEFGIGSEDLCDIVNEVRREAKVPELKGVFLERQINERPDEHVKRLHTLFLKSLTAGIAPILECRRVEAEWDAEQAGFSWSLAGGHYVVVLGIHRELDMHAAGFEIEYADSDTGRKGRMYIHKEPGRDFKALLGNGESGKWIGEQPFLAAAAPQLELGKNASSWAMRSLIYIHYAVCRD